jgi:hypothetical protein
MLTLQNQEKSKFNCVGGMISLYKTNVFVQFFLHNLLGRNGVCRIHLGQKCPKIKIDWCTATYVATSGMWRLICKYVCPCHILHAHKHPIDISICLECSYKFQHDITHLTKLPKWIWNITLNILQSLLPLGHFWCHT